MRINRFLTSLAQAMIRVTPMIIPKEVFWAKAARGVWGMAHVLDGKYFTREHMQGNFRAF